MTTRKMVLTHPVDLTCLDTLEPGQRRRRVLMTKGVYQVETILEKRVTNGKTMFKIKWEGFDH